MAWSNQGRRPVSSGERTVSSVHWCADTSVVPWCWKTDFQRWLGLFCPFAHRVNLVRHLKGLEEYIEISIVKPYPKGDEKGWPGWKFPNSDEEYPGATVDHLFGSEYLHEIYFKADKEYKGRYSVPVLWDKKTNTIVNNVCPLLMPLAA
jgi:putative glutathione S-transferase